MNWDMISNWEAIDLLKIVCSIVAGLILGAEREQKDKSAGLKTIATICLGSTLFTILSYKVGAGESEDATRIASYVVSGIGFLGAGVIFKDGLNVSGLTTASIIWMSAAIGMAIGFGEFVIALCFLASCILIIYAGNSITRLLFSSNISKILTLQIKRDHKNIEHLTQTISTFTKYCDMKKIIVDEHHIELTYDLFIDKGKLNNLYQHLSERNDIIRYEI